MTTYYLWAEHTRGKSVSHPCTRGVWSDPAEALDFQVEAENEDEARDAGVAELERLVSEARVCDCPRRLQAGSNDWWESVVVAVSRTPYPKYTGDEN
jgi:hypothetical protein